MVLSHFIHNRDVWLILLDRAGPLSQRQNQLTRAVVHMAPGEIAMITAQSAVLTVLT